MVNSYVNSGGFNLINISQRNEFQLCRWHLNYAASSSALYRTFPLIIVIINLYVVINYTNEYCTRTAVDISLQFTGCSNMQREERKSESSLYIDANNAA